MKLTSMSASLLLVTVISECFGLGSSATLEEARTLTHEIYKQVVPRLADETGKFIRSLYKDGCLGSNWDRTVQLRSDCERLTSLRWSFEGPLLIGHRAFLRDFCLTMPDEAGEVMEIYSCGGSNNQKWNLAFHLNLRTERGDQLFSIHNNGDSSLCATVTVDSDKADMLVMKKCVESVDISNSSSLSSRQLFFIERDWFEEAISARKLVDVHYSHRHPLVRP